MIPCGGVPAYLDKTFPSEASLLVFVLAHPISRNPWLPSQMACHLYTLQDDQMKFAAWIDETFPGEDRQGHMAGSSCDIYIYIYIHTYRRI